MKIHHIAIWSKNIEVLSNFYVHYFSAVKNKKYENKNKGFCSYFLKFENGCSLELMEMNTIPENKNNVEEQYLGLIHIAISLGSKENVDKKTNELRNAGYLIISEPRWTGDGYYESCIYDPDKNRIEITV